MPAIVKIVLGALLTAAVAWFLHGPMGFGARCLTPAVATPAIAAAEPAAPMIASPVTAEAVTNCQARIDATIKGKTINFANGLARLAPDSLSLVAELATAMKDCAGTAVQVAGHTDARGNDAANLRLSEARANSVVAALVEKGVPADRLTPKGFGETAPIDPATTAEADAQNRRIEFSVASSAAMPAATGQ